MKDLYKKTGIFLFSFALIALSVIPVFVEAYTDYTSCVASGTPVESCQAEFPTSRPTPSAGSAVAAGTGWLAEQIFDANGLFFRGPLFFAMKVLAGILGMAGLILDQVMIRTVVNFSDAIKSITAINSVWATIRDLGNMAFIFILLYHGIRMVLGLSSTSVKKVITGIITAAILVNFSLFFTKALLDASNIVTLGFYNSIAASAGENRLELRTETSTEISPFGFSGAFMKPLGITGLFDLSGTGTAINTTFSNSGKLAVVYIGSIIFLLIAILVFLAVSVLFVIRFVAFVILLIMSPLAFLSFAIPGLEGMKAKYWGTLSSQGLFGPLYMFYSWIILRLMGPGGITGSSNASLAQALMDPNKDTINVIINFVILIALLLMSIIEAKKQATKGGFITNNMINKGQAYMGAAVFGSAAWAGRNVIGSRAAKMAEDKQLQKDADLKGGMAKIKLNLAKFGAKSSFDARNTKVFEKATGNIGDLGAIGSFGKGMPWNEKVGAGGYSGAKKADKDKYKADLDEVVDRYRKTKDWETVAEFTSKQKPADQSYIYEKLSPRDRIAVDEALDTKYGTTGYTNPVSTHVRSKLTLEERDKTDEAGKKAAKIKKDENQIKLIESLVAGTPEINPATGNPYTYDELLLGSGRNVFSPKNARNLSIQALNEPNIIQRLKPQHLADIMANNDDLDDATIRNIVSVVETGYAPAAGGAPATPPRYPYQSAQYSYLNKAANYDNWHI